jgi:predicted dehydrogenase
MGIVLFGCGWQGRRHVVALQQLSVKLDCIVDVNPDGVHRSLPDYQKENIYSDSDLCFANHHPEMAIIATNSSSRLDCVKKCVDHGIKKIFCEKPMATNLIDAAEMIKITKENDCLLAVNHLRRWSPNHLKMKSLIDSDVIGDIKHIYFQCGSTGLGNVVSHVIDNIRYYTDSDIEWVIGQIDATGTLNPRGSQYKDPGGWGMLKLMDGTRVFIDTCENTGVPHVFEMVGTYGRIVIEEMNNHWQVLSRSDKGREEPLTKYPTPLFGVEFFNPLEWDVTAFTKNGLKELIFENKTSCSGYDGYKAIECLIAMHLSDSRGGEKIKLPLVNNDMSFDVPWA